MLPNTKNELAQVDLEVIGNYRYNIQKTGLNLLKEAS